MAHYLAKWLIGVAVFCEDFDKVVHNIVMEELIEDAKAKNLTLHTTHFDLEDAFGSVPHALILDALTRHFLPQNIIKYKLMIMNNHTIYYNIKFNQTPTCVACPVLSIAAQYITLMALKYER